MWTVQTAQYVEPVIWVLLAMFAHIYADSSTK